MRLFNEKEYQNNSNHNETNVSQGISFDAINSFDQEEHSSHTDDFQDTSADIPDFEVSPKAAELQSEEIEAEYRKREYLRFGADKKPDFLDTDGSLSYLEAHGFGNNNLTQAREKIGEARYYEQLITKVKSNVHYCDFCGKELGIEYDSLSDGRERCNNCSRTIINSVEELSEAFIEIERNMEVMFGISFFTSIDVRFVDSNKIARMNNETFVPTPGKDPRTLGFVEYNDGVFSIWIENQSPYLTSVATIAFELTYVWQYLNWNEKKIEKKYRNILKQAHPSMDPELIIHGGMAKWVEIQYLLFINETQRAMNEIKASLNRADEYGLGFALFYKEYGLTRGTFPEGATPFSDKEAPLHEF